MEHPFLLEFLMMFFNFGKQVGQLAQGCYPRNKANICSAFVAFR
jgi:hypothetical protein